MQTERLLVWLVGLVAIAVSVAAYLVPGVAFPAEPVLAVLVGVVALPVLFVVARRLYSMRGGERGWS